MESTLEVRQEEPIEEWDPGLVIDSAMLAETETEVAPGIPHPALVVASVLDGPSATSLNAPAHPSSVGAT